MSQPAFDTYKAVETLSDAEPGEPLAVAIVDTIGAAMENVATKDDIKHVHERFDNVNSRFDNVNEKIDNVKDSVENVKESIDVLEKSMDAKFIAQDAKRLAQTNQLIRWSVGSIIAAMALIHTYIQFFVVNIP